MSTFIKYPLSKTGRDSHKGLLFIEVDRIESSKRGLTVFPKTWTTGEGAQTKTHYSPENKIGFYCKSLSHSSLTRLRGNFNIEHCTKEQLQSVGRDWYYSTGQKLPRKTKKRIIGKSK